jgi:hypothetical protein
MELGAREDIALVMKKRLLAYVLQMKNSQN